MRNLYEIHKSHPYVAIDNHAVHAHAFEMREVSMRQIALRWLVYEMLEPSDVLLSSQLYSSCKPTLPVPTRS